MSHPPTGHERLRFCVVQMDGVPQALSEYDKLWLPAEPLAPEPGFLGTLSTAKFFSDVAGQSAKNILNRIQRIATDETQQALGEILEFIDEKRAHVAVLPEYLLPIECLELVIGSSRDRAIVAGLGVIRNQVEANELARIAEEDWDSATLVGRNVSILVENERVHIVTKRALSEREAAESGSGPATFEVPLAGRSVRIAVATCMDFLRYGDSLVEQNPVAVCIPAFTPSVEPFLPDAPRNFVRLIANCSRYGGSTIIAPGLRNSVFSDKSGVTPIQSGHTAIIMIDYSGYQTQPTSLTSTANRLVVRSEVVQRSSANDVAINAISTLNSLADASARDARTALTDQIGRWIEHIPGGGPLAESLIAYRRAIAQDLDDEALYALLSTHLTISAELSEKPIRARQAEFVTQRVGDLIASGIPTPPLGAFLDAYRELATTQRREREANVRTEGERWSFALRLGAYDPMSAASTLPRQLNFLRSVAEMSERSISITYRLQSRSDPYGPDLRTAFDVIVTGDAAVLSAEQVEGQLRSMLVASWPIEGSEEEPTPRDARHWVRITPDLEKHNLSIRDDWAPVFDLIRTHSVPITMDMRVVPLASQTRLNRVSKSEVDETMWMNTLTSMPYLTVGDEGERQAAAYFGLLQNMSRQEPETLGLSVVLSSSEPIPLFLAETIRHEIFGPIPARLDQVSDQNAHEEQTRFNASELIRIFHPPYGRIQGRGQSRKRSRRIPYDGPQLPRGGTRLGSATVAGPRHDREVDVNLDESARVRHIYAIGRTGTGKTNLLKELCRQDVESGRGLVVIDPHGDLVDYLARHCQERIDDTVLLDYSNTEYVPVFNPLLVDIDDTRSQNLHVEDFLSVLETRYYNQFTGPVFDDMVRQALETMFQPGFPAVRSLDLVESMYRNAEIRRMVAQSVSEDPILRDRWNVYEAMTEHEKAERVVWMLSKFADLMPTGSPLRASLCSTEPSPLSIEKIVWNDGVLLVKIPEASMGSSASSFIGSLLLRRVQRAAFDYERGTGVSPTDRTSFGIYIDEFQKFATAGLENLVAEARKFGCSLTLSHQNLDQLEAFSRFEGGRSRELLNAILGNVGTTAAFRVGPQDAAELAEVLRASRQAFDELPRYMALCKLIVESDDTPCFTLKVSDANKSLGIKATADRLADRMVDKGFWVRANDATERAELNMTAFEVALEQQRGAASREFQKKRAAQLQRLHDESTFQETLDEMAETEGARSQIFVKSLLSKIITDRARLAASTRQELVDLMLGPPDVDGGARDSDDAVLDPDGEWFDGQARIILGDSANYDELIQTLVAVRAIFFEFADASSLENALRVSVKLLVTGYLYARATDREISAVIDGLPSPPFPLQVPDQVNALLAPAQRQALTAAFDAHRTATLESGLGMFESRAAGDAGQDGVQATGRIAVRPRTFADVGHTQLRLNYDFGALLVVDAPSPPAMSAIGVVDGTCSRLRFNNEGDARYIYVDLFGAPDGSYWNEHLSMLKGLLARDGIDYQQIPGPFGSELRYVLKPDDDPSSYRVMGFDGNGWLLVLSCTTNERLMTPTLTDLDSRVRELISQIVIRDISQRAWGERIMFTVPKPPQGDSAESAESQSDPT